MAHKAIVAKITEVIEIPGADKIHVAKVLGESVVVSKEWGVGFLGVLFPVDVQLSEGFTSNNNLYRHSELNKDTSVKGFFDDNRRVRAQPFLKVKSEGFFTTLSSLEYLGANTLKLGDVFDELNGKKVCEKYYSEDAKIKKGNASVKKVKQSSVPFFEKHVDSDQLLHFGHNIAEGSLISVHSKKHGTSFRVGKLKRHKNLSGIKRLINKFAKIFPETSLDFVVGTRNVIIEDENSLGFHGKESYRFQVLEDLKPHLEDNMIIFGEIVGYVNGKPIMSPHDISKIKNKRLERFFGKSIVYSYGCKEHEFKFFVYRVAYNYDGEVRDFTQKQLEKWCDSRGIPRTTDLCEQFLYDGDFEALKEKVVYLSEREAYNGADPSDPSHLHEGAIVRVDSGKFVPDFYKYKTFNFKVCEGHLMVDDIEEIS